jgi:hypothetical protein
VDVKPTQKVKRDKYVLTAEEIAERPDITNAYDAVKLLRSQFLKATRAKGGITGNFAGGGYRPDVIGRPGTGMGDPPPPVQGEVRASPSPRAASARAARVATSRASTAAPAAGTIPSSRYSTSTTSSRPRSRR